MSNPRVLGSLPRAARLVVVGALLAILGGCTADIPQALASAQQTLQAFVQDFLRNALAAYLL